jgi:hypothetical protein
VPRTFTTKLFYGRGGESALRQRLRDRRLGVSVGGEAAQAVNEPGGAGPRRAGRIGPRRPRAGVGRDGRRGARRSRC